MHPKTEIFLLDSFGVKSLGNFIGKNSKKTINKMLLDIENMTRTDDKLSSFKRTLEKLSTTAQDFFPFAESFGKLYDLQFIVSIWMLEDQKVFRKLRLTLADHFKCYFLKIYLVFQKKSKYKTIKN